MSNFWSHLRHTVSLRTQQHTIGKQMMETSVPAFMPSALGGAKQKNKSGRKSMVSTDKTAFSMRKNTSPLFLSLLLMRPQLVVSALGAWGQRGSDLALLDDGWVQWQDVVGAWDVGVEKLSWEGAWCSRVVGCSRRSWLSWVHCRRR